MTHGGGTSRGALIGDAPLPSLGTSRGSRTQRFAERNRRTPTPAERQLAQVLREHFPGGDWISQWAFDGKWILDFCSPLQGVGIEVDGGYHSSPKQRLKDDAKTRACDARGITVVRLTNREVFGDRTQLLRKIQEGFIRACVRRRSVDHLRWSAATAAESKVPAASLYELPHHPDAQVANR
jgi:very-short-patch-repair endonuclease